MLGLTAVSHLQCAHNVEQLLANHVKEEMEMDTVEQRMLLDDLLRDGFGVYL